MSSSEASRLLSINYLLGINPKLSFTNNTNNNTLQSSSENFKDHLKTTKQQVVGLKPLTYKVLITLEINVQVAQFIFYHIIEVLKNPCTTSHK